MKYGEFISSLLNCLKNGSLKNGCRPDNSVSIAAYTWTFVVFWSATKFVSTLQFDWRIPRPRSVITLLRIELKAWKKTRSPWKSLSDFNADFPLGSPSVLLVYSRRIFSYFCCYSLPTARYWRLIRTKNISKSASTIVANPHGKSGFSVLSSIISARSLLRCFVNCSKHLECASGSMEPPTYFADS